jgi:hypothetical protein
MRVNVKSILVTNTHAANSATVLLDWYNVGSSTQRTMLKNVSLPVAGILQITDSLWLEPKDYIIASADAADSITLTLMLELIPVQLTIN